MIERYYLDESGSTGDLAQPGERFDFGQQQIFTLACLDVDDEAALGREIERLRARYRIRVGELKSSSVRAKPEFIGGLVDYVGQNGLPLMIEVVDKRFMIAATMMSTLIAPHVGAFDFTPQAWMVRNAMAEYLHRHAPPSVFEAYVAACDTPSGAAVTEAFLALLTWLRKSPHQNDEVGAWLYRFASDSLKDFTADPSPEAFRRSLPLPDLGKHGQSIWMLPNLSSFTNIYARINLLHRGRVGGVTLFHDEQAHFDDVPRLNDNPNESLAIRADRDSAGCMIRGGFLDSESRRDLIELARDGSAANRLARRANALVLLDDGLSCEAVANVLLLGDDTVRHWYRLYQEDGIEGLANFGYEGGACRLSGLSLASPGKGRNRFGCRLGLASIPTWQRSRKRANPSIVSLVPMIPRRTRGARSGSSGP